MELHFEQVNYNTIESRSQVLEFILRLCESEAVAAICTFTFFLDDITLVSSVTRDLYYMQNEEFSEKYELKTDVNAIETKLAGLYVKKEEILNYKLKTSRLVYNPDWNKIRASYHIEPGLKGLRRCVSDIKSLNKGEREDLPDQLRDLSLDYFRFRIGIVWEKDRKDRLSEDGAFRFTDSDRDYINGRCDDSSFWFVVSDYVEDLKFVNTISYMSYLNFIHNILEEVAPDKFDIRPEFGDVDLLEIGILNRNEKGFYLIGDLEFEEAEKSYHQELNEYYREENRKMMQKFDNDIAKYEDMKAKGHPRAKERRLRLQEMKTVMSALAKFSDNLGESDENEKRR